MSIQRRLEAASVGELSLRVGVNTGEVVAGRPREGSSFVSGDAVNVAARLVFLVGAQADELVRKDATPGEKGLLEGMRTAFG